MKCEFFTYVSRHFLKLLIFGLHWVFIAARGLSLVAVREPLLAAASLVMKPGL